MLPIIILVLILLLIGVLPIYPYSMNWGWGPSGLAGLIFIVLVIALLTGRL